MIEGVEVEVEAEEVAEDVGVGQNNYEEPGPRGSAAEFLLGEEMEGDPSKGGGGGSCNKTSLTFTPTPLEVAKSSIVALIIFSVFVTTNTALLQACLPFWRITCMLVSAVVVRCFDGQAG